MNTYAVHPSAVLVLLQMILALAPVVALTVVSWRMGRRAGWLAIPWSVAVVVGAVSLGAAQMAMAHSALAGVVTWPYLLLSALHSATAAAVLTFSIVLASAGCSLAARRLDAVR